MIIAKPRQLSKGLFGAAAEPEAVPAVAQGVAREHGGGAAQQHGHRQPLLSSFTRCDATINVLREGKSMRDIPARHTVGV